MSTSTFATPSAPTPVAAPSAPAPLAAPSGAQRLSVLLYGGAAYLIGVAGLVGLIAHSLGIRVLPAGPFAHVSPAGAVAIDVGLLVLFALQHSIMARKWFKER